MHFKHAHCVLFGCMHQNGQLCIMFAFRDLSMNTPASECSEISEVLPAIEGKLAICLWAKFLIFDDGVIMLPAPKTVRHVIECNKILVCVWMGSILACINSISKLQTDLDLSTPSSSCHKQNTRILLDKQKSTDQQTKIHWSYKTNKKQQSYKTNKKASIL